MEDRTLCRETNAANGKPANPGSHVNGEGEAAEKELVVPEKFEAEEARDDKDDLGELIDLRLLHAQQRGRFVTLVLIAFLLCVVITSIYSFVERDSGMMSQVFDAVVDIVMVVCAFFLGQQHEKKRK